MVLAAVVLTGGAGNRMGGVDKPRLPVAGRSMLDRVLAAVVGASTRVVVGPADGLPPGVLTTREEPAGGGPVAAIAAAIPLLTGGRVDAGRPDLVAVLAGDLPLLTPAAVQVLVNAVLGSGRDGAVLVDGAGRRQWLCGVWRLVALRAALAGLAAERAGGLAGASVRAALGRLDVIAVSWTLTKPPPWFDCDTVEDIRRAEEWLR